MLYERNHFTCHAPSKCSPAISIGVDRIVKFRKERIDMKYFLRRLVIPP